MEDRKILHLHLADVRENKKTLIVRLKDGSIKYIMYGGTGSSGMGFSLSNIQFYEITNGNMRWLKNASLPVENLPDETLEEFKERVIKMLNNSTHKVINVVNNKVTFK